MTYRPTPSPEALSIASLPLSFEAQMEIAMRIGAEAAEREKAEADAIMERVRRETYAPHIRRFGVPLKVIEGGKR